MGLLTWRSSLAFMASWRLSSFTLIRVHPWFQTPRPSSSFLTLFPRLSPISVYPRSSAVNSSWRSWRLDGSILSVLAVHSPVIPVNPFPRPARGTPRRCVAYAPPHLPWVRFVKTDTARSPAPPFSRLRSYPCPSVFICGSCLPHCRAAARSCRWALRMARTTAVLVIWNCSARSVTANGRCPSSPK